MAEHGSLTQKEEVKFLFFVCWNKQYCCYTENISGLFISVINQLDAQKYLYNKFISYFYMFRAHVFIIRRLCNAILTS